jgi:hypothetical protein
MYGNGNALWIVFDAGMNDRIVNKPTTMLHAHGEGFR